MVPGEALPAQTVRMAGGVAIFVEKDPIIGVDVRKSLRRGHRDRVVQISVKSVVSLSVRLDGEVGEADLGKTGKDFLDPVVDFCLGPWHLDFVQWRDPLDLAGVEDAVFPGEPILIGFVDWFFFPGLRIAFEDGFCPELWAGADDCRTLFSCPDFPALAIGGLQGAPAGVLVAFPKEDQEVDALVGSSRYGVSREKGFRADQFPGVPWPFPGHDARFEGGDDLVRDRLVNVLVFFLWKVVILRHCPALLPHWGDRTPPDRRGG